MGITAADIVVGAHLRWRSQPGGRAIVVGTAAERRLFTIVSVDTGVGVAGYSYGASARNWLRPIAELVDHAELVTTEPTPAPAPTPEPPEKCTPECNPAVPCLAHAGCPGNGPEYTGNDGFSAWLYKEDWRGTASVHDAVLPPFGTAPQLTAPEGRPMYILGRVVVDPPPVGPEPMRNGSGALACDWIERSKRG